MIKYLAVIAIYFLFFISIFSQTVFAQSLWDDFVNCVTHFLECLTGQLSTSEETTTTTTEQPVPESEGGPQASGQTEPTQAQSESTEMQTEQSAEGTPSAPSQAESTQAGAEGSPTSATETRESAKYNLCCVKRAEYASEYKCVEGTSTTDCSSAGSDYSVFAQYQDKSACLENCVQEKQECSYICSKGGYGKGLCAPFLIVAVSGCPIGYTSYPEGGICAGESQTMCCCENPIAPTIAISPPKNCNKICPSGNGFCAPMPIVGAAGCPIGYTSYLEGGICAGESLTECCCKETKPTTPSPSPTALPLLTPCNNLCQDAGYAMGECNLFYYCPPAEPKPVIEGGCGSLLFPVCCCYKEDYHIDNCELACENKGYSSGNCVYTIGDMFKFGKCVDATIIGICDDSILSCCCFE